MPSRSHAQCRHERRYLNFEDHWERVYRYETRERGRLPDRLMELHAVVALKVHTRHPFVPE
eukprot:903826-Amphidinium_carterae.1